MASGAGGLFLRLLCGRIVLYSRRQFSIMILASFSVKNNSRFNNSSRNFPLKLSLYPFSQGLPGSIKSVLTPICESHCRTSLAVNSGPLSERI